MTVRFAQRLFLVCSVYGVVVVAPLLFLEQTIAAESPPAITHPEFFYGFVWVALAWQIVYLMMSRDPLRYRPLLVPAVVGKAGFAISALVLFAQGRLEAAGVGLAGIDLLMAGLFVWAFLSLRRQGWREGG